MHPTPFLDLNGVLDELVKGAGTILGPNFVGAYLQGSFAVGDADAHSDVDFIVVTDDEVTAEQEAALQELHRRLFAIDVPWAQHLEGSYITRERLRRVDPAREPLLYLDNGATQLIRDAHCNTAVVRWSLREHGVVLAGPEPKALVEPVHAAQLRAEILAGLDEWTEWTRAPAMSRWKQPYVVLSFCRMLHTLETGRVGSKREAGAWAVRALGDEWSDLIRRALGDRPDPWGRVHEPADRADVEPTRAFADYAAALMSLPQPPPSAAHAAGSA